MSYTTVGTCSICGGAVVVPTIWHSILPPTPYCIVCGATAANQHGPVIPMQPNNIKITYSGNTSPKVENICNDSADITKGKSLLVD